jgi:hypothetical protein
MANSKKMHFPSEIKMNKTLIQRKINSKGSLKNILIAVNHFQKATYQEIMMMKIMIYLTAALKVLSR